MTPKQKLRRISSGEASLDRTRESVMERKAFNLREDSTILSYWLQQKSLKPLFQIAQKISESMGFSHSAEAIIDRIKKYLSKLTNFDHEYIIDESQVSYFSGLFSFQTLTS